MYKVIGADGKQYGPVTLEQLRNWVAESRLGPQSRVLDPESGEWKNASEIPEISALLVEVLGAAAVPSATPGQPPGFPAPRFQGMAITSFVLGILSVLCLGLLTGLPAIITGHIAHNRAKRNPAVFGGAGFAIAGFVMGYVSVLVTLVILPAMLLPALSRAKGRAQEINCVNNLKQVGLAFKIWELDHQDEFPFNVSTNAGGTAELASPGEDGVDANAVVHFQVLSNELATPKILVCPADTHKHAALTFDQLQPGNISYLLRSGTNISDAMPQEVLARCPVHGTVLHCDGGVMVVRKRGRNSE